MTPNPMDLPLRMASLWLRAASLGLRTATMPLRVAADVTAGAADRVAPHPSPEPEPSGPPEPSPKQRRRAARREPTRAQAAETRLARSRTEAAEARQTDALPSPGPEIEVAEPWEGYAAMPVVDVLARLADADDTTRAAVRLYEGTHEAREAVLHVTEG